MPQDRADVHLANLKNRLPLVLRDEERGLFLQVSEAEVDDLGALSLIVRTEYAGQVQPIETHFRYVNPPPLVWVGSLVSYDLDAALREMVMATAWRLLLGTPEPPPIVQAPS